MKKFFFNFFLLIFLSPMVSADPITTIVIDPNGDVIDPGNSCSGSYERSITLQCAESIKQKVESSLSNVSIILSRSTGFVRSPHCVVELAHRMNAHVVIHIRACMSLEHQPTIYTYVHHSPANIFAGAPYLFVPLDCAHVSCSNQSLRYAQHITTYLHNTSITLQKKPIPLPLTPLTGFAVPACTVELCITQPHDVIALTDRIAESLITLCKKNNHA